MNFLNYLLDCLVTFIESLETPTLLRYFDKTNLIGLIELISIISIYIVFFVLNELGRRFFYHYRHIPSVLRNLYIH